ncbi:MAG TPA: zf-HC2 domain-containing protein [Jatrophihabitans sp.]|jgi:anti-sigma factor RsiW|uniref:anti-sigma factor family protein n=1 Tax=Jatrophihabitans sp. TaxID=1932789 RepID=UPI002DFA539D|nr:zf-HC2 domain-containing protein [Jatrophihabitans sp.]
MSTWDGVDFGGITCREFVELVTEYLEDRLAADARARFDQHVAVCPGCARYLDQIRVSSRLLGRVTLDPISPQSRDQLRDAFRSWRADRPEKET